MSAKATLDAEKADKLVDLFTLIAKIVLAVLEKVPAQQANLTDLGRILSNAGSTTETTAAAAAEAVIEKPAVDDPEDFLDKATAVEVPAAAAAPAAPAKPVETAKAATGPTKEQVAEAVRAAVALHGGEKVKKVVEKFGAARATLTPESEWPKVIEALKGIK